MLKSELEDKMEERTEPRKGGQYFTGAGGKRVKQPVKQDEEKSSDKDKETKKQDNKKKGGK